MKVLEQPVPVPASRISTNPLGLHSASCRSAIVATIFLGQLEGITTERFAASRPAGPCPFHWQA
jgi:hypothetical protein